METDLRKILPRCEPFRDTRGAQTLLAIRFLLHLSVRFNLAETAILGSMTQEPFGWPSFNDVCEEKFSSQKDNFSFLGTLVFRTLMLACSA